MEIHPIADEQPLLSVADYESMKEDIRENGLLVPIVPDENGLLLDGRHRLRACKELGIPVWLSEPVSGTDEHKRARSISLNEHRRQLTEEDKRKLAGRLTATINAKHGTNRFAVKVDSSAELSTENVTIADAAKSTGLSHASVKRLKVIQEKGIPELYAAYEAGTVSLTKGEKIARLTKAEQRKLAKVNFKLPKAPVVKDEQQPPTYARQPEAPPKSEVIINAKYFRNGLQPFLAILRTIDRTSDTTAQIANEVNHFYAAACSLLCDMEPIVSTGNTKKSCGLFAEVDEEKAIVGRKHATSAEFDAFYAVFPRKTNKEKAREAFKKAFIRLRKKHGPDESTEIIMQGARIYSERANPEALCHPTTWLNGSRWEDDPDSIGSKSPSHNGSGGKDRSKFGAERPEMMKMTREQQRAKMLGD